MNIYDETIDRLSSIIPTSPMCFIEWYKTAEGEISFVANDIISFEVIRDSEEESIYIKPITVQNFSEGDVVIDFHDAHAYKKDEGGELLILPLSSLEVATNKAAMDKINKALLEIKSKLKKSN